VSYIVTAKNAADVTTSNYTNGASDLASFSLVAEATANDGSDYTTRLTQPASSNWNAGVYTLSNTTVAFSRSATPEPSYSVDIGLKAIDTSDGVNFSSLDMNAAASGCGAACDAVDLSGNPNIRWGRLTLSSASGSEYQSLPLPLVTQYYTGSTFVTNTIDGCTNIARTRIEFNGLAIDTTANLSVDIGGGTDNSTGNSINTDLTSADLVIVSGSGDLVFSAPSDNDRGSFTVDIDLADLPHLEFDWDLDGNHDDSPPTAIGTFGVYGGHDKVLFKKLAN
jgi:MSHA biogenesis protein MshQ